MIKLKTEAEINIMRRAGAIVADILNMLREIIKPGVSTGELDEAVSEYIKKSGAIPAFKGYKPTHAARPFPGVICTSVNSEIVHGIPRRERILLEGDILSVDVGVCWHGYYGDAACTYPVGEISESRARLLKVTLECLNRAIASARKGNTLGDLGHAVESLAFANGYGIVRDYTGHGLGTKLHEAPQIPNYGKPGRGISLKSGMTLAIEPMIMAGREEVITGVDDWVVLTADGSDAAHFEKSVVITDNETEILTPWQN
ncbi:MAG: type I methionyl aminopeptidase [Synergistaceae bacterium]|nr:type I methionyl aminopeptidase [Synergistaceae bacterium]